MGFGIVCQKRIENDSTGYMRLGDIVEFVNLSVRFYY